MKHVLGYGLLGLALVGAGVWGYKCCHDRDQQMLARPAWGDDGGKNFLVDLETKDSKKHPGMPEVTDHPADYNGSVNTFVWKFSEPFSLYFKAAAPCNEAKPDSAGVKNTIDSKPDDPSKPNGSATAKCTLTNPTAGTQYPYHVYLTTRHAIENKPYVPGGVPTCDGCFIEVDDPTTSPVW